MTRMDGNAPFLLGLIAVAALAVGVGFLMKDQGSTSLADDSAEKPAPVATPATDLTPDPFPSPPYGGATLACTNTVEGFTISYPEDWFTVTDPPEEACRYFGPQPVSAGDFSAPVVAGPADISYEELLTALEAPDVTIVSRADTMIASRPAVAIEAYPTEDPGAVIYLYAVDVDGEGFFLQTVMENTADYETAKTVVDLMAGTLTFP